MSSSKMTQNLMGAGFLSSTGASKAFDADANGYCRAEGAGIVVLKPLRDAVRNGDFVLGVITGSAVNQGGNTSSITVPDGPSQCSLYQKVLARSGRAATDVTYVEAHGTGTQVGDPIEFKSIRDTFGGVHRKDNVYVGSIKDNIGHTEASSGVASLIKTLLMIHNKTIPKQANFRHLNPKIEPLGRDHVLIPKQSKEWEAAKRIALINNYGAGGNNGAIVVEEWVSSRNKRTEIPHFPIFITGKTPDAVRSYCGLLGESLNGKDLADVSYNLAIKQNRDFENSLALASGTIEDLSEQLKRAARGMIEVQKVPRDQPTIILCFGGQDGRIAHLSKALYDNSASLRYYLVRERDPASPYVFLTDSVLQAECESVITEELSLTSLFPDIFDPAPFGDIVMLHCVLFSIQYACAKSWLDSGVVVDRIIGHSFGQLTALCVAGSLSLVDALKLVSERAELVKAHCGPENGVMLAVEAELSDVHRLLTLAKQQSQRFTAEIVCYNGPYSFVIAGNDESIQVVETVSESLGTKFQFRRLENSHAFHSQLLDAIVPNFHQAADKYHFENPVIPIEACSNDDDWSVITAEKIVRHTRMPVHFMDAVRRIEAQANGHIIWLEAGSGSAIVPMIKRAVTSGHRHTYIPTTLRHAEAPTVLAKAVCRLWSNGVRAQFWPFHRSQHSLYTWVNLPPYQFARASHWLEYNPRAWAVETHMIAPATVGPRPALVTLLPNQTDQEEVLFEINPDHEIWQLNTKGHEVVDQTLVPASLYNEFVLTASHMLSNTETGYIPHIANLSMSSPLVVNPIGRVFAKLVGKGLQPGSWDFTLFSQVQHTNPITHATGRVTISNPNIPAPIGHLRIVQGLMFDRCRHIESSPISIGFKGPTAYQAMRPVVTYLDYYHGIQSIYSLGNEATARITLPHARPKGMGVGFCDPVLTDSFTQVSGILANCFSLPGHHEMWVCNYIRDVVFTQRFIKTARVENKAWIAYSKYSLPDPNRLVCNIFVFEPETQDIVLIISSIEFQKVSIRSLKKVLARLNDMSAPVQNAAALNKPPKEAAFAAPARTLVPTAPLAVQTDYNTTGNTPWLQRVRKMLQDVLDIPLDDITPDSVLEDLGVDSLLATELFTEMHRRFSVSMTHSDFVTITNVRELSRLLSTADEPACPSQMSTSIPTPESSPIPTMILPQPGQAPPQTTETIREILRDILEVPIDEISPGTVLKDVGVDSLLATELFSEIHNRFKISISYTDFALITNVEELAQLVSSSSWPSIPPSVHQPTSLCIPQATRSSSQADMETIVFAERDGTPLSADIYYPEGPVHTQKALPVGA